MVLSLSDSTILFFPIPETPTGKEKQALNIIVPALFINNSLLPYFVPAVFKFFWSYYCKHSRNIKAKVDLSFIPALCCTSNH